MHLLSKLVASFGVLALTLLAALPLGVPASARLVLPLLPALAIVHHGLQRPQHLPASVAFVAGLLLDVLTHGPLGYWSFVYLLAHLVAPWLAGSARASLAAAWTCAAGLLAFVGAVEWLLNSIYFLSLAPVVPRLVAAAVAAALYSLLLLAAPAAQRPRRRPLQLERRG